MPNRSQTAAGSPWLGLLLCLGVILAVSGLLRAGTVIAPGGSFAAGDLTLSLDAAGFVTGLTDPSGSDYNVADPAAPLLSLMVEDSATDLPAAGTAAWYRPVRWRFTAGMPRAGETARGTYTFDFADTISVTVAWVEKPGYATLEVTALRNPGDKDLRHILWGPLTTSVTESIGETVGVVRGRDFAIGLFGTNAKTQGGWPTSYPATGFNAVVGAPAPGAPARPARDTLAAARTAFGSMLQAHTQDYTHGRVVDVAPAGAQDRRRRWVPALAGDLAVAGQLVGSKVALFGVARTGAGGTQVSYRDALYAEVLARIGAIEVGEGLPHPVIDKVWAKQAVRANAPYLLLEDLRSDNLDTALRWATELGWPAVSKHGCWGVFARGGDLPVGDAFGGADDGLRAVIERAGARHTTLGVELRSNWLPAPYAGAHVGGLASADEARLAAPVSATADSLTVAPFPGVDVQQGFGTTGYVAIGKELIRYTQTTPVAGNLVLSGLRRGFDATPAQAHAADAQVKRVIRQTQCGEYLAGLALMRTRVAERLVEALDLGLGGVSFAGAEGLGADGYGALAANLIMDKVYRALADNEDLLEALSVVTPYTWHVSTRAGVAHQGEFVMASGLAAPQLSYPWAGQVYAQRNYLPRPLLGRWHIPDANGWRWALSRAAALDAGLAYVGRVGDAARHDAALRREIRHWRHAGLAGAWDEANRLVMQDRDAYFKLDRVRHAGALGPTWQLSDWTPVGAAGGQRSHSRYLAPQLRGFPLTNLARDAQVTVSGTLAPYYDGAKAVDGFAVAGHDGGAGEWAIAASARDPWIELAWETPRRIREVVLFDRASPEHNVQAGRLTFTHADGATTTQRVGALPVTGAPKPISVPSLRVTKVRFTIEAAVGDAPGLAEFAVLGLAPAYQAGNLATGAAISGLVAGQSARVNDGVIAPGAEAAAALTGEHALLDLGGQYYVGGLTVWHAFGDGRRYRDVVFELADNPAFTDSTIVFNNDADNSLGLGAGTDAMYEESSAGKQVLFAPVPARYLRLWSRGNTVNDASHLTEVEVYGVGHGAAVAVLSASAGAGDLGAAIDGDPDTAVDVGTGRQYLQLDLGAPRQVNSLAVLREADLRAYRNVVYQLSNDANFTGDVTTVFHNDRDNVHGLALAESPHGEYPATANGHYVRVAPVTARYVRLYSNGSDRDRHNRYHEVLVGTEAATVLPTPRTGRSAAAVGRQELGATGAATLPAPQASPAQPLPAAADDTGQAPGSATASAFAPAPQGGGGGLGGRSLPRSRQTMVSQLLASSNATTGSDLPSSITIGANNDVGIVFRTGPHSTGYNKVANVRIQFQGTPTATDLSRLTVTIRNVSGGNPGRRVIGTFTNPATGSLGWNTFTASAGGIELKPSTSYALMLDVPQNQGLSAPLSVRTGATRGNEEASASGWSIRDKLRRHVSNSWESADQVPFIQIFGDVASDTAPPMLKITGVPAKIGWPDLLSAPLDFQGRGSSSACWLESAARWSFTVTFTFSEPVTGFDASDVTVTGGKKGLFLGSGADYMLVVTPMGGVDVEVTVAQDAARDAGNNIGPAAAVSQTAVWDGVTPTLTITGVPGMISARTSFTATFTFSEAVSGFSEDDITVTGGAKGAFTGADGDTVYTLVVTPAGGGAGVTVSVPANVATDGANRAPLSFVSATAAGVDPALVFVPPTALTVNEGTGGSYTVALASQPTGTVTVTITSDNTDVTFDTNSVMPGDQTTPLMFTTSSWNTAQTVTVAAGQDLDFTNDRAILSHSAAGGGYDSVTGDLEVTVIDDDSPLVTLAVSAGSIAEDGSALTLTATISANNTSGADLDIPIRAKMSGTTAEAGDYTLAANISISNGARTGTTPFTATDDNADEPSETVVVELGTLPPGYVGGATTEVTITITDNDATTVTLAGAAGDIEEGDTKDFTVTLGRALVSGEILPVPLTFVTGSGAATRNTDYTTACPSPLPTGVTCNNLNTAATPTVTFTGPSVNVVTLTLSALTDNTVEASGETVTIGLGTLGPSSGTRLDGGASGSDSLSFSIDDPDITAPTLTLTGVPAKIGWPDLLSAPLDFQGRGSSSACWLESESRWSFTVTFTFSEDVTGFDASDVTVTGGKKGLFLGSGADYMLVVTPMGGVDVEVTVAQDAARDAGNNIGPAAAVSQTAVWDGVTPTLTITGVPGMISARTSFTATFTFSEAVSGFSEDDITVTGGAKGAFTGADGDTVYTLVVTPAGGGAGVTVSVPANAVTDGANRAPLSMASATAVWRATPTVSLTVSAASIKEGAGALTLTAARSEANTSGSAIDIPIRVKATDTTAQANDYTALAANISIPDKATEGTTTFAVTNDSADEPPETVVIELHTPPSGTALGSPVEQVITLIDNDPTPVTLARTGTGAVAEGGTATLTVTLGRDLIAGETVTAPLTVSGTGVTAGDYTLALASGGSLNEGVTLNASSPHSAAQPAVVFTGGANTEQVATLTLTAATDGDANETLSIGFGSVESNLDRADASTSGTGGTTTAGAPVAIVIGTPTATLVLTPATINESGASNASTVTATLSSASSQDLTLTVSAGTGVTLSANKALTIDAGETASEGTVTLTAEDNDVDAADLTVTVSAVASGGNGVANPAAVTLTITDDDARGVTVTGSPLTLAEADDSQTDAKENEGTYTVVLDSRPTSTVIINLSAGANPPVTLDKARLTFASDDWGTAQTVTVTAVDDAYDNAGDRRTASITHTVVAGTSDYSGVTVTPVSVTVNDDDAAPTGITLTVDENTVGEGDAAATTVTVTATVNGDTRYTDAKTVTVSVGAGASTATSATDYAAVANFDITIAAGEASATGTFDLTPIQDTLHEGAETIDVTGASGTLDVIKAVISLTDDDAAPSFAIADASAAEGDAVTFTVTRSGATGAAATVKWNTADDAADDASPATAGTDYTAVTTARTLSFAVGDSAKTFTVATAEDSLAEGDETFLVKLSDATGGATIATDEATGTITDDDAAPTGITLTVDENTVGEGDEETEVTVTAMVNGATRYTDAKTVTVSVGGGASTATSATDYAAVANFDITIAAGAASATGTFDLTPTQDTLHEGTETIDVTGASGTLDVTKAVISLTDDDAAPSFAVADASAAEGDAITFTVTRSGATGAAATVKWNTADDAADDASPATAGTDYTAVTTARTLSFAVGDSAKTFTVATTEDTLAEGAETFLVELSDATGATIATDEATGTITDDDTAPTALTLTVDADTGTEGVQDSLAEDGGAKTVRVTATLGGTSTFTTATTVTVAVGKSDDSATEATDYETVADQIITIPAGASSAYVDFTLTPKQDVLAEGDESIALEGTATGLDVTDTEITLTDDESLPAATLVLTPSSIAEGASATVTATLSVASSEAVTLTVSAAPGTGAAAGDYTLSAARTLTFAAGATASIGTVTIAANDDEVDDAGKQVTVSATAAGGHGVANPADATLTITDNDARGVTVSKASLSVRETDDGTTDSIKENEGTYTVVLDSEPAAGTVTVAVTSGDTKAATVSPARLTFNTANWRTAQTVTVTGVDDDTDNTDDKRTVSVTHAVSTTGTGNDYAALASADPVTVTVTDDDAAPGGISLSVDTPSLGEGADATEVTVTATVTGATRFAEAQTVAVSVGSGTAMSGTDYDAVAAFNLTILAMAASGSATFTLTPTDDDVDETNETIDVTGALAGVTVTKATISLTDDDTRGVTVTGSPLTIDEADDAQTDAKENEGSYTVVLDSRPTASVTINLSAGAGAPVTLDKTSLTFAPGDWNTAQTVTVTAVDDAYDNPGDERAASITHTVVAGTSDYGGVTVTPVSVTVNDDDAAPSAITLTVDADTGTDGIQTSVAEGGGAKTVRVTATLAGTSRFPVETTVTLAVGTSTDGAREGTDYETVADQTITIAAGASSGHVDFDLTPKQDVLHEGAETISLDGTSGTLDVTDAAITLTDDDAAPTGVTLSVQPNTVGEGDEETEVTVTAMVNGATRYTDAKTVTVSVGAGASTATSATDYAAVANFDITIAAGAASATGTFDLTPTQDTLHEGTETIDVTGASGTLDVTKAVISLTDDDAAPTALTLTVDADTGTEGVQASIAEDGGAKTVRVTATIGGTSTFTTATTVTVAVGKSTDSAREGTDYATVADQTITIAAGASSGSVDFTLTPTQDVLHEGSESISLDGTSTGLTVTVTQLSLTDDDTAPTATLVLTPSSIAEGASATVTATLSGASSEAVTLTVVAAPGTGAAAGDFTLTGGTLTFAAGVTASSGTVTIAATDDEVDDAGKQVTVSATAAGGHGVANPADQTLTVRDDDTRGVTVSKTELTLAEADDATTEGTREHVGAYTVVLDSEPAAGTVTVAVTSGDTKAATVSPANLTFNTTNWSTAQTVTVTGVDDDTDNTDDKRTVSVTHAVSTTGDGNDYAALESADPVEVTVTDDDAAPSGIALSVDTPSLGEGAGATEVTVTATVTGTIRFAEAQTVAVSVGGGTATSGTDYDAVTAFNLTIPAVAASGSAAFTLTPTDDDVDEDSETIDVTGSLAGVTVTKAVITLADDDTRGVTTAQTGAALTEGDTTSTATFTVALDTQPSSAVTVTVSAPTGLVLDGPDSATTFTASEPLSFTTGNWDTAQTVTFMAADDNTDSPRGRSLSVTWEAISSDGDYQGLSGTAATVTVTDNDPTTVTLAGAATALTEGGSKTFTVTLGRALVAGEALPVPLTFATGSGTATRGTDYTTACPTSLPAGVTCANLNSGNATVTFTGPSAEAVTLTLTATGDLTTETGGETVNVGLGTLNANSGTNLGGGAAGTDNFGPFRINDPAPSVITLAAGAAVTEGANATWTLTATPPPVVALPVSVTVADATGSNFIAGDDEGAATVTFTANAASATLSIPTQNDSADERSARVTALVTPGTGYTVGAPSSASVLVRDNDPTVATLTGAAANVMEGATKTFTLSSGRALRTGETLTVPLTFAGTATRNTDYTTACPVTLPSGVSCNNLNTATTPTVTFTGPAAASVTLTLSATTDNNAETGGETVDIGLGTPTAGVELDGGASTTDALPTFSITDPASDAPATPTGLAATAGDAQVALSWGDPGDSDIDGYEYRQGSGSPFEWGSWTGISGSTATTVLHTVTGLTNGTEYSFQVRAVDGTANGAASGTVTATPAPPPGKPANLAGAAGDGEAVLTWDNPNNSAITGYEYSYAVSGTLVGWTAMPGSGAGTTTYTLTGLDNGGTYQIRIRALAGSAEGTQSDLVTVTLPVVLPTVTIAAGASPVAEGTAASFTLTVDRTLDSALSVAVGVADAPNADFVAAGGEGNRTVSIPTSGSATFTVATTGDSADEPSGPVTATVATGTDYAIGSERVARVTVTDNDATAVTLAGAAGNVEEGDTKTFTVTLGRALVSGESLPVPLTFSGGAVRNTDYTTTCATATGVACQDLNNVAQSNNPRVTFTGPSANAVTLTLSATADNTAETGDETVDINLGTLNASSGTNLGGGASGTDSLASFSITDPAPTDTDAPTATLTDVPAKINSTTPFTARVTFNEAVTGFIADDITVTGGTAGTFTATSTTVYTLAVTPTSGSSVTVTVTADAATDGDANTGPATAVSATAVWDASRPTLDITGVPVTLNSTTDFTATFTFSEPVTGFARNDITVTGGTAGTFTATSATVYTLAVIPAGNTNVVVTVTADAASDGLNTGPASQQSATATWEVPVNSAPTVNKALPDRQAPIGQVFGYTFPADAFIDADTGDTLSYSATLSDGTALPDWLSFDDATRTFSGTPQSADAGTLTVRVTADDNNGGTVYDEFDIVVAAAAATVSLQFSAGAVEISEAGNARVEVQLSEAVSAPVDIYLTVSSSSAIASDVAAVPVGSAVGQRGAVFGGAGWGARSVGFGQGDGAVRRRAIGDTQGADPVPSVDYIPGTETAPDGTTGVYKVTIAAGDTTATLIIPIINDDIPEANEFITVTIIDIVGVGGDVIGRGATPTIVAPIVDDEYSLPEVSVASAASREGNAALVFAVRLSAAPGSEAEAVVVDYITEAGTATRDVDYRHTSGTLRFGAGETAQQVAVSILDDEVVEGNETLRLVLSNPVNASLAQRVATGTILDDDSARLFLRHASADEGTGEMVFKMELVPWVEEAVTVDYTTVDRAALAGADYTARTGTLTFEPGKTRQELRVPLIDDAVHEGTEQFSVQFSNLVNAEFARRKAVNGWIYDNDVRAVMVSPPGMEVTEGSTDRCTIRLATQPTGEVTLALTTNNPTVQLSPARLTFDASNWSQPQPVQVTAPMDTDMFDSEALMTYKASGADYEAMQGQMILYIKDINRPDNDGLPDERPIVYPVNPPVASEGL